MPGDEAARLLLYAKEREEEAMLFQRWIMQAQYEMSFEDFKEQLRPKPVKSEKAILSDVENIMKQWEANNGII